ncbi:TGFA [Branchiostoma lanceolatum]|uniref:TGFA protein n=1 Tax=Branchiostoma lanceolatum TaxID=7740 RepID=A0A8J9ZXU3_BRALA|nr:TGFA [Branchiostoma lanceolatum]
MVRDSMQYLVGLWIALCLCSQYAQSQTPNVTLSQTSNTTQFEATPQTLTVHPTSTPQRITNGTGEEVTSTTASTGHFETCPPEFEGYCYEGTCKYIGEHPDPKQRISCSCPPWKRGPRCQHSDPDFSRKDSVERALLNSYVVIGTLVGLLVLVAIPAAAFFCRRSRHDRESNMDARDMREAGSSATLMEP